MSEKVCFKKIYLLLSSQHKEVIDTAVRLSNILEKFGTSAVVHAKHQEILERAGAAAFCYSAEHPARMAAGCDLVMTIGGDGTVLKGAEAACAADLPLAGINEGRIGYLAKIPAELPEDTMQQLLCGQIPEEQHMTLSADWDRGSYDGALNDITVSRIPGDRMCTFRVYSGEEMLGAWRSDGIILFTPLGSTAYAYSAGGPAVDPEIQMIGVIPLCAQSGRNNAMICASHRTLSIVSDENRVAISADGRPIGSLEPGSPLEVRKSKIQVRMIRADQQWRIHELNQRLNKLTTL